MNSTSPFTGSDNDDNVKLNVSLRQSVVNNDVVVFSVSLRVEKSF